MQNRYVGDLGDYAKFALLRALCLPGSSLTLQLSVVWCLYPDENHNNDGRHIGYLRKSNMRYLDPDLHDRLGKLVEAGKRSVKAIHNAGILPQSTVFYDHPITQARMQLPLNRIAYRREWLSASLEKTSRSDLVFFDPDNGFETRSVQKNHSKAGKYIFFDELIAFGNRGQSLIVYHHTNRSKSAENQVQELKLRLHSLFRDAGIIPLLFRRGSCRIFFVISMPELFPVLQTRISRFLASGWDQHFSV